MTSPFPRGNVTIMEGHEGETGSVAVRGLIRGFAPALLSLSLALATAPILFAQEPPEPEDPDFVGAPDPLDEVPETEAEALDRVLQPFTEIPGPKEPPMDVFADGCDGNYESPNWQEDTQEFFRDISCHTFRWADGLFGDEVDYPEEAVNGLTVLGLSWNEYEGWDTRTRFRVRAPLPNMDNRFDVILGRGDEDAFISDTQAQDSVFYNPGVIDRGGDDSLLLGLGGRRRGADRKGWDWSLGARLRAPPVPYVRLRYYWFHIFSPETDLRFRQTFFWRSDDGFGTTTRGDLSHAFRPQDVMRWEAVATLNEVSPGVEWYVGQTWFHLMRDRRAFSVLAFANGETDGVGVREAGFNFIFRQPFTRDWIWLSYGPSATWPRFFPEDERELSLGFSVQLEMEFGNWVYR
ncbi:MAG: hypothetical protein AAGH19_08840 [Pseudomonadota bacterium]